MPRFLNACTRSRGLPEGFLNLGASSSVSQGGLLSSPSATGAGCAGAAAGASAGAGAAAGASAGAGGSTGSAF